MNRALLVVSALLHCSSSLMPHHLPHASHRPRRPPRRLSLPFASLRLSTVDEAAAATDESSSSSSRERLPYFMDASQSSSEVQVVQVVPPATASHQSLSSSSPSSSLLQSVIDKIGYINETRLVSSAEYQSGQEPKLFSNLVYKTVNSKSNDSDNSILIASHSQPSITASAALTCGTALGSGLLFLPHAIGTVGLNLPSLFATLAAYGYMTVSSLLTAELLINACGETGKVRNVGLLGLYHDYLGDWGGKAATIGFVGVSYVMMGIYFGLGGDIVGRISTLIMEFVNGGDYAATTTTSTIAMNNPVITTTMFASAMAIFLATASKFGAVQRVMTNYLVPFTLLAYIVTISMGLPTTPSTNNELFYTSLFQNPSYQHPELVLNAFPLLFMSWSCHSVVPRVVYDLECDARKIKFAIWGGSTTALVMYLIWNLVVLGNVFSNVGDDAGVAVSMIQNRGDVTSLLANTRLELPVAIVSGLAVVTSLIGTILGFVNEFYDAVGALPSSSSSSSQSFGPKENSITKWQVALLTLTPSILFSIMYAGYNTYNHQQQLQQQQQQLESLLTTATIQQISPNTIIDNTQIMEYTGAFGASTLFLILPALMVWQNRYGEESRPLTVKPMFPLGKISLGSLYKAAGTLIVEQGLEKLGVFEFVSEHFLNNR
eukprot:scaffold118851_cov54-Cyclotella_meneghiniana.AAC.2